ncbi:single-stranded DNA-binding protein [Candidatus Peregrinibacteria bacterium CG11_big_fil_rev_8_21_14_0_20_46_8]|nr:MAG: single-stranded DNA-binding protein [Candidatus Peregrinibacteria bacterium CG11_big_fil_rev_8_21_14_0_20_46_8]
MRSVNKVVLIGNLTRDPEMRVTPNDQHITTFAIATNREWTTNDGRKQQSTEFHDVVCWGRLAERCEQYLKKGKLVYIEGYLKTRSWDDATGLKRYRTEIVAEELIMLDKREDSSNGENINERTARMRSEGEQSGSAGCEPSELKNKERMHGDLDLTSDEIPGLVSENQVA